MVGRFNHQLCQSRMVAGFHLSRQDYAYVMEKLASGNQHLPILHKDFADGNASFFGCYCTLPKTNIAPENGPSQKETSIPTIHFQVLC